MWGLRAVDELMFRFYAMFPTHVGIALHHHARRRIGADVPYACGDCATLRAVPLGTSSCSLRMWGLRAFSYPLKSRFAMFPTHVGIARSTCLRTGCP